MTTTVEKLLKMKTQTEKKERIKDEKNYADIFISFHHIVLVNFLLAYDWDKILTFSSDKLNIFKVYLILNVIFSCLSLENLLWLICHECSMKNQNT